MAIKLLSTYTPAHEDSPFYTNDAFVWYPVLAVSNSPYSMRNFNQYFNISYNTKKTEKYETDNKIPFYYPHSPDSFPTVFPKASA